MGLSKNTLADYRTFGFVLKRTNYGEADRIINIITPKGKLSAVAKGARKNKSKLAGGIELFSLIDFNIHAGKSDLALVTGAKMIEFYGEVLKDFDRMELAGKILKTINRISDSTDNPAFYDITKQCFEALNDKINTCLVDGWFYLNVRKAVGEELNFYRDNNGVRLNESGRYVWDSLNEEFVEKLNGEYGANEIKLLRAMSTMKLRMVARIRLDDDVLRKVMNFIRIVRN